MTRTEQSIEKLILFKTRENGVNSHGIYNCLALRPTLGGPESWVSKSSLDMVYRSKWNLESPMFMVDKKVLII